MDTLQEFHDFFSAIPPEKWNSGSLTKGDTHCALGHLQSGYMMNSDAAKLTKLLLHSRAIPVKVGANGASSIIWHVNDGYFMKEASSPKERLLLAIKLAMDSESISDWLDNFVLDFMHQFDLENGVGVEGDSPVEQISQETFEEIQAQSKLAYEQANSNSEQFVRAPAPDAQDFIAELLASAEVHLPIQDQFKAR